MRVWLAITCLALPLAQSHLPAADDYTLGPDSQPQPGVPKGQIYNFTALAGVMLSDMG